MSGPIWGKGHENQVNWTSLPAPERRTVWTRGSVVEVATGIAILHSGGWSYRLCKAADGAELTEECFQQGALKFASDTAKVHVANSTAEPFTIPVRHTPDRKWTRIPVPSPEARMPAKWCKSPEIFLQKENSSYMGGASDTRYTCLGTYPNTTGVCAKGDDWVLAGHAPRRGRGVLRLPRHLHRGEGGARLPLPVPARDEPAHQQPLDLLPHRDRGGALRLARRRLCSFLEVGRRGHAAGLAELRGHYAGVSAFNLWSIYCQG